GAETRIELQGRARGLLAYMRRDGNGLSGEALGRQLDLAGTVDGPQTRERLRDRLAPAQQAVVAQHQNALVAQARQQPRLLVWIDGDALKVVVRDLAVDLRRVEVVPRQALLLAGHRHARRRMRV